MKVAVCYGAKDIRIEEKEIGTLSPEEVLVKVAYCGICPSDLKVYNGLSSLQLPAVLGHEFVGWVEAVGSKVCSLEIGTRVVVDPARKCYTQCPACQRGYYNKCVAMATAYNGFAEYHITKAANVYPLQDSSDLEAAALTEPLACVLHGQAKGKVRAGTLVVIVGAGPIGLLHLQAAKFAGTTVIVSDLSDQRLDKALEFGADYKVNPLQENLRDTVMISSQGWGAETVIVAAGAHQAVTDALDILSIGGTMVIFAGFTSPEPVPISPNRVHYDEINITGSSDYNDVDFITALRFIEKGYIDTKNLISDIVPLEKIGDGMELMASGTRLKILVKIN